MSALRNKIAATVPAEAVDDILAIIAAEVQAETASIVKVINGIEPGYKRWINRKALLETIGARGEAE